MCDSVVFDAINISIIQNHYGAKHADMKTSDQLICRCGSCIPSRYQQMLNHMLGILATKTEDEDQGEIRSRTKLRRAFQCLSASFHSPYARNNRGVLDNGGN
jgi:hypothetical protein